MKKPLYNFMFQPLAEASGPPLTRKEAAELEKNSRERILIARLHAVAATVCAMVRAGRAQDPNALVHLTNVYPGAFSKGPDGNPLIETAPQALMDFLDQLETHIAPLGLVPRLAYTEGWEHEGLQALPAIWISLVPKESVK